MNLSKKQREEIRQMFDGKCAYCGVDLPEKGWHADHVKAVRYDLDYVRGSYDKYGAYTPGRMVKNGKVLRPENDVIENIFPSCRACNIDKGSEELEDWRAYLQGRMIDVMRRDIPNFRHAERFGLISVSKKPIVFWFEKYRGVESEHPSN